MHHWLKEMDAHGHVRYCFSWLCSANI